MEIKITQGCAGPSFGSFGAGRILTVGSDISKELAMSFLNGGIAVPVKRAGGETAEYPVHVGGGMYETSSGQRIRGKAAARQAELED